MTKLAAEWVGTSDPVIRSPARYRWTTAPASYECRTFLVIKVEKTKNKSYCMALWHNLVQNKHSWHNICSRWFTKKLKKTPNLPPRTHTNDLYRITKLSHPLDKYARTHTHANTLITRRSCGQMWLAGSPLSPGITLLSPYLLVIALISRH